MEELPPFVPHEGSISNSSEETTPSTVSEEEIKRQVLERAIDTEKVKQQVDDMIKQDEAYQATLHSLKEQEKSQQENPIKVLKIDSIEALCSHRLSEAVGENTKLWEEVRVRRLDGKQ